MRNALAIFERSIDEARHLTGLYDFLSAQITVPYPFEDLLRAQVVYVVGAFDRLMHSLIRIGMRQTYMGTRPATAKYRAETVSLDVHAALVAATVPPAEYVFELEVSRKIGHLSYQRPGTVSDGLSLIWEEKQKWAAISAAMGMSEDDVKTKLTLISTRRNSIVHESDLHPMTDAKSTLTKQECIDITDFIHLCGRSIASLVT